MLKLTEKSSRWFRVPQITRSRIIFALVIAVSADGLQFLLTTIGWFGPNQIIDVVTMIMVSRLIGFHWLLLPTFALELVPLADDLPTWTACVIAVIAIRKREQRNISSPPPLPAGKPPIEI
jgi:hypothetical protein